MIKKGSKVSIHYTLTVDGEVRDSSRGDEPLEYTHGKGTLVDGFEEQLLGMKKGQKKNIVVSPEKGYGVVDPEAIKKISLSSLPRMELVKGGDFSYNIGGEDVEGRITELTDREVVVDTNHPLAGKTLHFDVEVMDVR
jgi:FKBP-type peptidyl-prolyl cis-trans isomerase SlyD